MDAAKPTGELIDFIYRDAARVASFYAQLFGGHLISSEISDAARQAAERNLGGSLQLLSGGYKGTEENTRSEKRTVQPHDIVTIDVIAKLRAEGYVQGSVGTAQPGSIIRASGSLTLLDGGLFKTAAEGLASLPDAAPLAAILRVMSFPSGFLLKSDDGHVVAGTIHESGLTESISAINFKHGGHSQAAVEVVGIKERAMPTDFGPTTDLVTAIQKYAEAVQGFLFPPEAIRVAPLAIFRVVQKPV